MASKFVILVLFCTNVMLKAQQQCPTTGCGCPGRCCLSVVENSEQGTPIGIVSSNVDFDLQSATNLLYSFTSSGSQFNVNADTGEISTAVEFDRETTENNCVSFGIQVTNNDNRATNVLSFAMEILDVNDNPPRFSRDNFTISIDETPTGQQLSCPGGPQAILAAFDPDSGQNGTVTYSIETGSGDEIFEVPNPSNPCVTNIVDLDRDAPPSSYSLVLIARDNGTPSLTSSTMVTFILNDINDNPPMFDSSEINITWPENNVSQTGVIYQFEANDIDEEGSMNIEYTLVLGPNQDVPFEINSTSGELSLTMPLNAELTSEYIITVSAADTGGLTESVSVTITVEDVNENKPVSVAIPGGGELMENEVSEESVVIQFDDIEATSVNQNNYVVILSGAEFFNVTTNIFGNSFFNFEIFQSTPVDRERNASVDLVIQVVQGGNPTFTSNYSYSYTITDKNDNAPYMPQSSYSREESEHGPDIFLNLCEEAMDDDDGVNGEVVAYELLTVVGSSGNDITPDFMRAAINQRNSHCILYGPAIDREKVGAILTVTLTLRDGGTPQMSSNVSFVVNISDVNDNRPKFPPTVYMFNVTENVLNAVVGFVEATDPDDASNGKVSYFLQSNSNTLFSINSSTGEIRTNSALDREEMESLVIYINASDNGTPPLYSTMLAEVRISVTDENDNIPTFPNPSILVDISSNVNIGEVVKTVMAIDLDSPPNDQILYRLENFSAYFSVDEMSGDIRVTQQLPNEESTYHLVISAYNQEFFELRNTVNVTIAISIANSLSITVVGGISGAVVVFVILIIIVFCITICLCFKNKRNKGKYDVDHPNSNLNNTNHTRTDSSKKSILKSASQGNGVTTRDRSVQFFERATEHLYDHDQPVTGDLVLRKETTTNLGSSDESPPMPPNHVPNGTIGNSPQEAIVDLDMSPRGVNGITGNHAISGLHQRYIHEPSDDDPVLMGYSQQTNDSQDINTYNSDGEDDDSTMSDDASNIAHFGRTRGEHPELSIEMRYPSYHHPPPHLVPHPHAPHNMSPNHPGHHGPVAPLRADFLAAHNAETNRYSSPHNDDLTPTHNGHQHESILSSHHTPTPPHPHLAHPRVPHHAPITMPHVSSTPPIRHGPVPSASRHYPQPFVFPDAYPRGTPDGTHRFDSYIHSLSDYGDASTYASTELNEALGFHTIDAEPEICSLTATDYGDSEESRL